MDNFAMAAGYLMGLTAIAVLLRMMRLFRQSRDEVRRLRRLLEYHLSHSKTYADKDASALGEETQLQRH